MTSQLKNTSNAQNFLILIAKKKNFIITGKCLKMRSQFATGQNPDTENLISMPKKKSIVPVEKIEQRILLIRGEKVIVVQIWRNFTAYRQSG